MSQNELAEEVTRALVEACVSRFGPKWYERKAWAGYDRTSAATNTLLMSSEEVAIVKKGLGIMTDEDLLKWLREVYNLESYVHCHYAYAPVEYDMTEQGALGFKVVTDRSRLVEVSRIELGMRSLHR